MKIALVHDDLIQWGGAERVFLEISNLFPDAPIYTLAFDKNNPLLKSKFKNKDIRTSVLQKIPLYQFLYKPSFLLHPILFEQFDFSEYDLVISHTSRFAKAIITKPQTTHISYVHTPPRFIWNFSDGETSIFIKLFLPYLRFFDQICAKRVDYFLAGSENAKKRIENIYSLPSQVLYPFVDIKKFQNYECFDGGYYLVIARLNKYKKIDIVIDTFNKLNKPLKVIGVGPEKENLKSKAKSNIDFLENVPEELLFNIIAGCRGLIVAAEEDFGLTALEAQAMGKPVIAYKGGGNLETVVDGKTGIFFEKQTIESLSLAVKDFEERQFKKEDMIANAKKFSLKSFQDNLVKIIRNFHALKSVD